MLILSISKDLDKLLKNRGLTSIASLCKLSGVVVMTIDLAVVFVVAILSPKYCWAYRACKVVNVVFSLQGSNIRTAQGTIALVTN